MAQSAPHAGSFHLSQTLFLSACSHAQVSLSVIPLLLLFFLCFPPLNFHLFPCFVETRFHVEQASHELPVIQDDTMIMKELPKL